MSGVSILNDKLSAILQCALAEVATIDEAKALLDSIFNDAGDALDIVTGWCGPHARIQDVPVSRRREAADRLLSA